MRNLKDIILERLVLSKNKTKHTLFPKSKEELEEMIKSEIKKNGKECSLNHIDVSKITDMSYIFADSKFNGDISEWDVSNVTSMLGMFINSEFIGKNSDISKWDVSNVTNMRNMFGHSKFDGDISNWNVSNVTTMFGMFYNSKFTGKNGDISNWNVSKAADTRYVFKNCPLRDNPPKWYNK